MKAEERSWKGFEVLTHEARWVCVKSEGKQVQPTLQAISPDGIDYFMGFEARDVQAEGVPATRTLQLRTSAFRVSSEPDFWDYLKLVVEGQMIKTTPWDRYIEVYKQD